MRLSRAAILGTLLGLALILSSCGGDGKGAAEQSSSKARTSGSNAGPDAGAAAASSLGSKACRHQLGGFVDSLSGLRRKLARGLSYDDYLKEVRGIRSLYSRIDPEAVAAGCLLVGGAPSERAFNLYIAAANAWGNCLATVACDTGSIEPRLQRKWALAARELTVAGQGLGFERAG